MSNAYVLYPCEALCAECKHKYKDHVGGLCNRCEAAGNCNIHLFSPLRLAGGALTPADEREAYLLAMRGGA